MRRVKTSGTRRMLELGHKRVEIWLSPKELKQVLAKRQHDFQPLATLVRKLAIAASRE